MIKYANSDINDGIKSLKIGIGNIIVSLVNKKISEYIVPNSLNYLMVTGSLQETFKEAKFKYSDKYININIDDSSIDIFFNEDSTKFII